MVNNRYPEDTIITKDDFDQEQCQKILDETSNKYHSMHDTFSKVAQKATEDGSFKQAKIYWLLTYATSMMLSPKNKSEPFKPLTVFPGGRSAIPDDFSEEDIFFFSEIIDKVNNYQLKARLADLIWLKSPKRNAVYALIAIDSYRKIAMEKDTLLNDSPNYWHRALSLAYGIRDGAGNRIQEMEKDILQNINSASSADGNLALWQADILKNFGLGKSNLEDIATKLESIAQQFEKEGNFHWAIDYFNSSSKWFELAGNKRKSAEMTVSSAESYVKRASIESSNMIAAGLYEKAIQILRSIPKLERLSFKADERIIELHQLMNEAGRLSLDEMSVIASDEMDITELVKTAKSLVTGKKNFEALRAFANLSQVMNVSEMHKTAIENIKQYPLSSLVIGTYISRDGRTIAKTSGFDSEGALKEDHPNVHATVMRDHATYLHLRVKGYILPALETLHLEQLIREINFLEIVQQSPIVPPGRERLFSKGLVAGYDYDYVAALHLLVPQVEHMVRYHLKNAGAKTSTLDQSGIENENGLSTLIALPQMNSVFGDDLTFEIKALFCDPLGANLRNEIAHGLIDDNSCNTIYGVYAWWLILKLVINAFWNAVRQVNDTEIKGNS
jgi:hypothetical protein